MQDEVDNPTSCKKQVYYLVSCSRAGGKHDSEVSKPSLYA